MPFESRRIQLQCWGIRLLHPRPGVLAISQRRKSVHFGDRFDMLPDEVRIDEYLRILVSRVPLECIRSLGLMPLLRNSNAPT